MGRFLQMDSYAGDYNNPLSLNLWTYCENDAVNAVDPSGHKRNIRNDILMDLAPWNKFEIPRNLLVVCIISFMGKVLEIQ